MARLRLQRTCDLPAERALIVLAAHFEGQGYERVSTGKTEVSLYYQRGSMISGRLDETRHALSLACEGQQLVLMYFDATGDRPASRDEERLLVQRTDEAMAHVAAVPPPTTAVRCTVCSSINRAGAAACAVCGSPVG